MDTTTSVAEIMQRHIRSCKISGQTVAAYYREQGLVASKFYYWQNQFKGRLANHSFVKLETASIITAAVNIQFPNGGRVSFFKCPIGITMHYSTVSGWIKQASELLMPVYDLHCREVLQANYLNVDETTIKVLDKDKKGATHQGYYWVYYDTQRKLALFDYPTGSWGIIPASHAAPVYRLFTK